MWDMQCGVRYSGVSDCAVMLQNEAIQNIRSALIIIKQKCRFVSAGWNRRIFSSISASFRFNLLARMSTVSAGRNSRLCPSISASFRFTRQSVYCIGQADLLDGRFARPAIKPAREQTGQNSNIHTCSYSYYLIQQFHGIGGRKRL